MDGGDIVLYVVGTALRSFGDTENDVDATQTDGAKLSARS